MTPLRAFVAGATGYTGRAVVGELRRRNIETVAHIRPESSQRERFRREFENSGAKLSLAPWEPDSIRAALETARPSVVFALLGTTRARAKQEGFVPGTDIYEQVDRRLTLMLLNAVIASSSSARFVYLSSLGVNAATSNPYLRARFRTEQAIVDARIDYVIARPSFITGPDRDETRTGERLGARLSDAALGIAAALGAGRLRQRYASMTGPELARALVQAALDPGCAGQTLEAAELRRLAALASV